jgi:hypothetical protein
LLDTRRELGLPLCVHACVRERPLRLLQQNVLLLGKASARAFEDRFGSGDLGGDGVDFVGGAGEHPRFEIAKTQVGEPSPRNQRTRSIDCPNGRRSI